jgi:hypothetical protein
MGEKKKTLFEINVENFEFSPSPRFSGELGKKLEQYEEQGSKLGLFGSKEETDEEPEEEGEASGGLFSRKSKETDETEEVTEQEETEVEIEAEEGAEDSGSGLALVIGLLFLLIVAAVATKFVGSDEPEEYEEVELSEYEN